MLQPPAKGGWIQILALELKVVFGKWFRNVNVVDVVVADGIFVLVVILIVVIDFEFDDNLVARGTRFIVVVIFVARKFVARIVVVVASTIFVFLLVLFETHETPVKFSSDHALALFRLFGVVVVIVLSFL